LIVRILEEKATKYKEISNTKEKQITTHISQRRQTRRAETQRKGTRSEEEKKMFQQQWSGGRLLVKSLKANRTWLRKQYEAAANYGKEECLRYK